MERVMPLVVDAYQFANVVSAVFQAKDTGDWKGEVLRLAGLVMLDRGVDVAHANDADYTYDPQEPEGSTYGWTRS